MNLKMTIRITMSLALVTAGMVLVSFRSVERVQVVCGANTPIESSAECPKCIGECPNPISEELWRCEQHLRYYQDEWLKDGAWVGELGKMQDDLDECFLKHRKTMASKTKCRQDLHACKFGYRQKNPDHK